MKTRRDHGGRSNRANRGGSEAERMRRHREEFSYALKHNLTILEARKRLAQLHFAELEERVHPPLKPAFTGLCGTEAPPTDADRQPAAHEPRFWWKDERL